MPATPVWLAAAEAALNRSIQARSRAIALTQRLEGKTLEIDVTGVFRLRAACHGGRLALGLGQPADPAADAVIAGSPAALLGLMGGAAPATHTASAQVRGDAEAAAAYRDLLRAARPDFEEELARLVGDAPARRAGDLARGTLAALSRAGRRFGENIAEYLQEESRALVNKTELEEFLRGVDELREASDRIEARLRRLERSRNEGV
jgi:ubiquinone biosynthesis protein UbiJ